MDFLKTEWKRIDDVRDWYNKLGKYRNNDKLDEVCYYILPIRLLKGWKLSIEPGYRVKGCSALRNSQQSSLPVLIPNGVKVPRDYSLIRITNSRKTVLFNEITKSTDLQHAIILYDWEELPIEYLYEDIGFDSKLVPELFGRYIEGERILLDSFQSPIFSAPITMDHHGGIGFSSVVDVSKKINTLLKITQLMVPPEYRKFRPPKKMEDGRYDDLTSGISIKLSEKMPTSSNIMNSVKGEEYKLIDRENQNRLKFNGEYSFVGTLLTKASTQQARIRELYWKFFDTEVTIPHIQNYNIEASDFNGLMGEIDEDLWIQNVHAKQLFPTLTNETSLSKYRDMLREDFNVILTEKIPESAISIMSDDFTKRAIDNAYHEAQSIARSENINEVSDTHIRKARDNLIDRLWMLVKDDAFERIRDFRKEETSQLRLITVQYYLLSNPESTLKEIWRGIDRTYFKSITDLEDFLRWMQEAEHLYVKKDKNGRYTFIE